MGEWTLSRALPKPLNSCRAEHLMSENMPNPALQRAVNGLCLRLQRSDDLVVDVPVRYVRHQPHSLMRAIRLHIEGKRTSPNADYGRPHPQYPARRFCLGFIERVPYSAVVGSAVGWVKGRWVGCCLGFAGG